MAANLAPAAVALALFVLLSPPATWDQPVLLGALAAIAAIAFLAEVRLKMAAGAYFDASIVLGAPGPGDRGAPARAFGLDRP